MTLKIKPWMIFMAGLPITFIISSIIESPLDKGAFIGHYIFFGLIILAVYHISDKFYFKKKKKINN